MAFSCSQATRSTVLASPWGATLTRSEAEERRSLLESAIQEHNRLQDVSGSERKYSLPDSTTQEHARLQGVLRKTGIIEEVCVGHQSYKVCTSEGALLGGFGASEHLHIGKGVKLKGLEDEGEHILNPKGVPLSFGHIIALAGDFYGVVGSPISLLGGTDDEKKLRFLAAFETLENADFKQLQELVQEIESEYHAVRNSGLPHHCYSHRLISSTKTFKKIKSDTDDLLVDNSDHFSGNAVDAYKIGHDLARHEAAEAKNGNDLTRLKRAYALDAFACHFLTDLFAAGHIRNQRGPLESFLRNRLGFDEKPAKERAGLLTFAQHEYDGQKGLNVYNQKGHRWRAYGDGLFFTPKNKANAKLAWHAVQCSADEVHKAYTDGKSIDGELPASTMDLWIPRVAEFNRPSIYQVGEEALYIRTKAGMISIESKKDYLLKAIPHALRYLPESYINDFINNKILSYLPFDLDSESLQVMRNIGSGAKKLVIPRIERLTGHLWHVLGLASYQQVQRNARIIREQNDENADILTALSGKIDQIQETVKEIQKSLEDLNRRFDMLPVTAALLEISAAWVTFRDQKGELAKNQATALSDRLWIARGHLGSLFSQNSDFVTNYSETLDKNLSPEEQKILVTRWFRRIITYQVVACRLNFSLMTRVGTQWKDLENGLYGVQVSIKNQLNTNEALVDRDLVYASEAYIDLQLQKTRKIDALKQAIRAPFLEPN